MLRLTQLSVTYPRTLSLGRLWRCSRSVQVRVTSGTREVDSFQASRSRTLRAALAPISRHLAETGGRLDFTGVEERWLPLGIGRTHIEVRLSNFADALAFLAGAGRFGHHDGDRGGGSGICP